MSSDEQDDVIALALAAQVALEHLREYARDPCRHHTPPDNVIPALELALDAIRPHLQPHG